MLCGCPLSILYQVDFTLRISTLNPLSGWFYSADIHSQSYIRLILLGGYPLSIPYQVVSPRRISTVYSQSYIRLILLCGYPLSILYRVDFTLRISTLNPISGWLYSADIHSQYHIRLFLLYGYLQCILNPISGCFYLLKSPLNPSVYQVFSSEEIFYGTRMSF